MPADFWPAELGWGGGVQGHVYSFFPPQLSDLEGLGGNFAGVIGKNEAFVKGPTCVNYFCALGYGFPVSFPREGRC